MYTRYPTNITNESTNPMREYVFSPDAILELMASSSVLIGLPYLWMSSKAGPWMTRYVTDVKIMI